MNEQDQIKALAELDGFKDCKLSLCYYTTDDPSEEGKPIKPYLTSYDAIIPLIQKQIQKHPEITFPDSLQLTPTQLCETFLRATKKWKE